MFNEWSEGKFNGMFENAERFYRSAKEKFKFAKIR